MVSTLVILLEKTTVFHLSIQKITGEVRNHDHLGPLVLAMPFYWFLSVLSGFADGVKCAIILST